MTPINVKTLDNNFAMLGEMQTSLEQFLTGPLFDEVLVKYPKVPFLEIGCGAYPVLPKLLSMLGQVDCLDNRKIAIDSCIEGPYKDMALFIERDILNFEEHGKYSLILDAHLLHCLNSIDQYQIALKNIYNSLKEGGLLFLETMVSHSKMSFEEGLHFDECHFTLTKGSLTSRLILPSIMIEKLILEAGFDIKLLKVCFGQRMIPHDQREIAVAQDPEVIRVIASRASNP